MDPELHHLVHQVKLYGNFEEMKSVDIKIIEKLPNILLGDFRWCEVASMQNRLRFIRDMLNEIRNEFNDEIRETKNL